MSNKKPAPLIPQKSNTRCPVCGEISYSAGGIHPQCAAERADAKRMKQVRQSRAASDAGGGA